MGLVPWRTLRGRLLLAALAVEAVMLFVLVANSLRLLQDAMAEQARAHARQIIPILNAALVAPLAQQDYATVQAVLDESKATAGIDYIAVEDAEGHRVGAAGWPAGQPLPSPDREFALDGNEARPRYDVAQPIALAGQKLGTLRFGLDLTAIAEARRSLRGQGMAIAGGELLLSAAVLTLLGVLITRQLSILTRASVRVAAGNLVPEPVPEGEDDVGQLGAAFNAMSRAVAERIGQLTAARDRLEALARDMEQEHARMMALLSAMEFGVLFTDRGNRVVYANPAFLHTWGLDAECIVGGMEADHVFEVVRERLLDPEAWRRDVEWGDAATVELVLADRRILTLERQPVAGGGDDILGQLWLFADVTGIRRDAEQLKAAKDAAEAASRAKAAFLATMSHEIRTPMNGIIGMTELTLDTTLDDQQREYLGLIRSSADTLLTIVNDILDFSKIEAGRMDLESIPFSPALVLGETLGMFRPAAAAKGIGLELRNADSLPDELVGDPTRIRQIVSNLVSNALKFTERGEVAVEVAGLARQADGVDVHFVVSDTGSGIPRDKLELIFSPFTQADSSTTRKHGGTGLGLAIVAKLVEIMGGRIWAESAPGQGARFHLTLHFALPDSAATVAPRPAPQPVARAARILVAEDNRVNQALVKALLGKLGHSAVVADNGEEALRAYREQGPFDLILMDMQMPKLDGLAATRQLRSAEQALALPAIPVVALTANASEADRRACMEAGMDDFLSKPFRAEDFKSVLDRHL
ncbi:MAG: response regulator [Rhodocyclaceae bacterium]|nr:response regulator [Rhodocyclaceae bacterium]